MEEGLKYRLHRINLGGVFQLDHSIVANKLIFGCINGTQINDAKNKLKRFCVENKVNAILHFNAPHYLITYSGDIVNLGHCRGYDDDMDLADESAKCTAYIFPVLKTFIED